MISNVTNSDSGLQAGGFVHPPEQIALIPVLGTWLLAGANFFFLIPLFYAFFLLQQANPNHAWQPKGVHPPTIALGALAFGLVVAAIAVGFSSRGRLRSQQTLASYVMPGRAVAGLLLGSVVVQIWQLSHLGFGISSGSFASCFVAMNVFLTIEVAIWGLWALSLANRASYESRHPIAFPGPNATVESPTPISALAQSYQIFALCLGAMVFLVWVVAYFF